MPKPQTLAARAGFETDPGVARPVQPAIYQSSVYAFDSLETLERVMSAQEHGFVYYRNGHPNAQALEQALSDLEGAEAAVSASSGMAATSSFLLSTLTSGDHVVADRNVYGGTWTLLHDDLPKLGIRTSFVNAQDLEEVEAAIQPNSKVLHLESLSNPTLRVADLPRLIALGKSRGLLVSVDNTFASPVLMRPLEHGADVVMHSLAKYIGGHSAVMGGCLVGKAALVQATREKLIHTGGTIAAFDAWLALIGLKTLPLRMDAHSTNALELANFLERHPKVARVDYPGLRSHPQHELALTLYPHGLGGMMAFELQGGRQAASAFVQALAGKIPLAPSLADVSSTLSYPAGTSHRGLTPEARAAIGVTNGLLRFSVGVEDATDLIEDLSMALEQV